MGNPHKSPMRYLGKETKDTNSQSCLGEQLTVGIERMGRVKNLEASKEPPLREVWALMKPPKYDLSTMLGQASEGLSP
jgi:hypothetical protein